jgi:hypothetical protein
MRLRDRRGADRLDPRIERDLAAVDAGLAGLEVSDDLAPIAQMTALASEERPSIDAEFAALLDERAAAGFPRSAGAVPRGAGVLERLRGQQQLRPVERAAGAVREPRSEPCGRSSGRGRQAPGGATSVQPQRP